jgi:hypothetical protein
VAEEHPKVFKKILLIYRLKGKDLTREKVEKAVKLSRSQKLKGKNLLIGFIITVRQNIRLYSNGSD